MASAPEILWMKVKEEPLVFVFLGLTCAALGGGLRTLANGDKRQSQLMMRARVFFQLCTVTTLAGTVYWKAYTGEALMGQKRAAGQKLPEYLLDSRLMDAVEGAQCALPSPPAASANQVQQLK